MKTMTSTTVATTVFLVSAEAALFLTMPSCDMKCPEGQVLYMDGSSGESHCVPINDPCAAADCGPDETCYVSGNTGEAACIPTPNPCAVADCGPDETCYVDGNRG